MSNGRLQYTFLWLIENYSYCWHKNGEGLASPIFTADELEGRYWRLCIYPRGHRPEDKGYVSVYIGRSRGDDGPKMFSVEYELSIVATHGESRIGSGKIEFDPSKMFGHKFLQFNRTNSFRKEDYLPKDTLAVRCKIWKEEGNLNKVVKITARSRISMEHISFLHVEDEFWLFKIKKRKHVNIHSHLKKGFIISSDLYCSDGKIIVETIPSDESYVLCKQKTSLGDASGNLIVCGADDNRLDEGRRDIRKLFLSISKQDIIAKRDKYLHDGRLSFLCECTFTTGLEFEKIEKTVKKTLSMSEDIPFSRPKPDQSTVRSVRSYSTTRGKLRKNYNLALHWDNRKNVGSPSIKPTVSPSALEDIKALYIDKCLTDVELKTETKSFPAHKIVLAARSPVFKAMLTSDMREKYNNHILIDDLTDDIVQQLLLFLYSDCVQNLQWTTSTQLYYAADKYQIDKLKELCSSFLAKNMTTSNVTELLVLSGRHSDTELKKLVEDFILQHEDQVFGSEEWDKLIETNPQLVIKTMHLKYKRKSVRD